MKQRGFWIDIHYATFGIFSQGNIITEAPPIAMWMLGKTLQQVKPWLLKKKAIIKELFL